MNTLTKIATLEAIESLELQQLDLVTCESLAQCFLVKFASRSATPINSTGGEAALTHRSVKIPKWCRTVLGQQPPGWARGRDVHFSLIVKKVTALHIVL